MFQIIDINQYVKQIWSITHNEKSYNNNSPVFTKIFEDNTYERFIVDMDAYIGQDVQIIIRHHDCEGQYALLVDDISVTGVSKNVELEDIEITKAPNKTEYIEGEYFNPAGMEVTAVYSNGDRVVVNDYTYSPNGALKLSNKEIVISYTENEVSKTTTQAITVNKLLKIEIDDIYENVEIEDSKYIENIKPKTSIKELLSTIKTHMAHVPLNS